MGKKKLFMIVAIAILAIAIIGGASTYAWYIWSTDENNETKIVTNIGTARVFYNGGANIENAVLKPTNNRLEDGIVKEITVKTDKETTYKISFNLYLDVTSIDEGLKDVSFRYALYKEGVTNAVKEGNFSQNYLDSNLTTCDTNSTNHIVLVSDETITTTTQKYTLYIWIDGENYVNPSEMQGKIFSFKLHTDGENAVVGETMVEHIRNLYEDASKTVVTNNEIDYNYAKSVNLMNDRLGGITESLDGGNIRYYGVNPNNHIDIGDKTQGDVKNWVELMLQFNVPEAYIPTTKGDCETFMVCSNLVSLGMFETVDACNELLPILLTSNGNTSVEDFCSITPAGTQKLYRIIGLFKDVELADGTTKHLIKVMREDSIGNFEWDRSPENVNCGFGINEWSQADLMKLLNPGFNDEEVGGSLYWNSASGNCYTSSVTDPTFPCDFTNSGLSEEARNKIETVKWNLGGHDDLSLFSNQIYEYERGENVVKNPDDGIPRTTKWLGKISLLYTSDYGYAVDFNSCSETLDYYENCISENWMYERLATKGIKRSWLLTLRSDIDDAGWVVNPTGNVYTYVLYEENFVSPTFYLDASLGLLSGDGSKGNPYVVG